MVDGQAALVFVDKDERGTGDVSPIDAQRLAYGPDEPGLSRSQIANQCHDRSRFESLSQCSGEDFGLWLARRSK
jgi:hypothetical protein